MKLISWGGLAALLTLVLGVPCAVLLARSSRTKLLFPLAPSLLALSFWPILPNVGLFFMAREFQRVRGAWPQVMSNDPKWLVGHVSPRFDGFYQLTNYLDAYSGAWMVLYFVLLIGRWTKLSRVQRGLFIGVAVVCLVVVSLDPGRLYDWWLD